VSLIALPIIAILFYQRFQTAKTKRWTVACVSLLMVRTVMEAIIRTTGLMSIPVELLLGLHVHSDHHRRDPPPRQEERRTV
jgi:hypothetical protein